jgi:hypothetical protein
VRLNVQADAGRGEQPLGIGEPQIHSSPLDPRHPLLTCSGPLRQKPLRQPGPNPPRLQQPAHPSRQLTPGHTTPHPPNPRDSSIHHTHAAQPSTTPTQLIHRHTQAAQPSTTPTQLIHRRSHAAQPSATPTRIAVPAARISFPVRTAHTAEPLRAAVVPAASLWITRPDPRKSRSRRLASYRATTAHPAEPAPRPHTTCRPWPTIRDPRKILLRQYTRATPPTLPDHPCRPSTRGQPRTTARDPKIEFSFWRHICAGVPTSGRMCSQNENSILGG